MFDVTRFIDDCRSAITKSNPRGAVRELLAREMDNPSHVAEVLGRDEAGLEVLYTPTT